MEKSIIVLFVKFFDQCVISKMIKRAKIFVNILSMVLIVFSWIAFNIALIEIESKLSQTTTICISIIYGLLIALIVYLQDNLITVLFPNEYFLMKSIKSQLGLLFRDLYISDVKESKIDNHATVLSNYIADLYNIQAIRSRNNMSLRKKVSKLAYDEFEFFLKNKIVFRGPDRDSNAIYECETIYLRERLFKAFMYECEHYKAYCDYVSNTEDLKFYPYMNSFLSSKLGKKFMDDYVLYNTSVYEDYHSVDEWCTYNKINIPIIAKSKFYQKRIRDQNKESYIVKKEKNKCKYSNKKKPEKPYFDWMSDI